VFLFSWNSSKLRNVSWFNGVVSDSKERKGRMRKWMWVLWMPVLTSLAQDAGCPAAVQQEVKSYVWVKGDAAKQEPVLREAAAFLEKAGHFYLATCEGDSPRVRPIKYVFIVDNKLLFVTSAKKGMYQQLLKNPKVEISRTAVDKSAYLRFCGRAVLCGDAAVKAKLLEMEPVFGKKFGEDQAIFLVEPERVGLFPMKGGEVRSKSF